MSAKTHIFFVASEGMQVTNWFQQILREIANVEFASHMDNCDAICIGDLTTNNHMTNTAMIASYRLQYPGKPLIIFVHDDPDQSMGFVPSLSSNLYLFRTSMCASTQQSYEYLLPSFQCEDQQYECLEPLILEPNARITVGFVGARTSQERVMLCDRLVADDRFKCDFVIRNAFHGHFNKSQQLKNNAEYKQNLESHIYQLCCRGSGNFSHRFYEVLASGRVPVLIDTDVVIPKHIPLELWRNCVVCASNVESVPDAIYAFTQTHDMTKVQTMCRRMWNDFLSYKGFAPVVASIFMEMKTTS